MATISGKRFQITDGASTPTNLFPYTVTEAVYGLSTVLANTQSAAVSAAATSAASLYLPLTGGTITGNAFMKGAILEWLNSSNTALGAIRANDSNVFQYYDTTSWRTVYHSGNANKSDVAWACSTLTASDHVYMANAKSLYWKTSGTSAAYYTVLSMSSSNEIILGYGASLQGIPTKIFGNAVSLYYGTTGSALGLILNSSGNVGIGTGSPEYKFHVSGGTDWNTRLVNTNSQVSLAHSGGWSLLVESKRNTSTYYLLDLVYGQSTLGTGGSHALYVRADGNAGVGTSTLVSGARLTVSGIIASSGDQVISSDINLKTNLQDVTYSVEDIAKTRAVTFDWKDGRGKSAGSIAQDWKPLIPELVHGEEGNMTLAYGQIALVNSILLAKHETEQDKEIARLKARVKELETRLNIS